MVRIIQLEGTILLVHFHDWNNYNYSKHILVSLIFLNTLFYDQYFSQIYHAQTIGATDAPTPRRKSVSLDGETFKIISDWKGHVGLHEKSDSKLIQDNRNFLEWFISTYIKKELEGIFFDATLELSVAGVFDRFFSWIRHKPCYINWRNNN